VQARRVPPEIGNRKSEIRSRKIDERVGLHFLFSDFRLP
jgi:hypothetical protein